MNLLRRSGRGVSCLALLAACAAAALLPAAARAAEAGMFTIQEIAYRDIDGDGDAFPDTGETGRLVVTVRNDGPSLTNVRFVLFSADPDVDCFTEGTVTVASFPAGAVIPLGDPDPSLPGLTFRTSDALEAAAPPEVAVIELCLAVTAAELAGLSVPRCTTLAADVDLPPGDPPPPVRGPDGIAGTGDDGIVEETFDIDKDGDGIFSVDDTFLQPEKVGGKLIHSGISGLYLRASGDGSVTNTFAGAVCGGFLTPDEGNPGCDLDPDFPLDWHFHCPYGATDCPNSEVLPGDTLPRVCVGGCSYDTPIDDIGALSPPNALHMGAHFDLLNAMAGNTTHTRALQAFVSGPINVPLLARPGATEMSFFHIVDLVDDHATGATGYGSCGDCADVQVQLDLDPDPATDAWGPWDKLVPFRNVYDHTASLFNQVYCLFTPADTGTEPPAPRGVHETICHPQGAWSNCGSDGTGEGFASGDCDGPAIPGPDGRGFWVETAFDLRPFLGRRLRIRWIGASWVFIPEAGSYYEYGGGWDNIPQDDGWWLDDIRVTGALQRPVEFEPDLHPAPPRFCPAGACLDHDGDGFGLPGYSDCPPNIAPDCDDRDPSIYPGAPQICDGVNNDCDDPIWPGERAETNDFDRDGHPDACDNCPLTFDPSQSDLDADGEGDLCDVDDGVLRLLITRRTLSDLSVRTTVSWDRETTFDLFNLYRGDLEVLRERGIYTQSPSAGKGRQQWCSLTSIALTESAPEPDVGGIFFYLVGGVIALPEPTEDLGTDSAGVPRPNDNPCR